MAQQIRFSSASSPQLSKVNLGQLAEVVLKMRRQRSMDKNFFDFTLESVDLLPFKKKMSTQEILLANINKKVGMVNTPTP